MKKALGSLWWLLLAAAGAYAYATLAFRRGEPINSAYILLAALCSYAIGYRFYSKWIAATVLALDDRRATPCEVHDDGKDFVKTNKWIVFGHHFAAISGPGPLVGPVLAAQFGYLPGTLWILIGVTLGGAVQDFVILFASLRRDGKSLGQMVKEELNSTAGLIALVAILAIIIILLAVLALVVVRALTESPWGVFTVGATIPIALLMGCYLRFGRVGRVLEASALGVALLLFAVWGGKLVHEDAAWAQHFALRDITLARLIIAYGFAASVLPVWLLLAPRDYLSTFMKLGTIFTLVAGIFLVLPSLRMPPVTQFLDGSGPVVAGKLFPFCFITIACGAISGFHTLIASGTTPKILTRETYARPIGYGAMCLESLVAIMALIAACTLEPGVYLSMNVSGAPEATVAQVSTLGFPVTTSQMSQLANEVGEKTLFGRTGGAATLAVGMAQIFSRAISHHGVDLWYHFAIMFEALFILTTLDAGTRVGRYLLQDALGAIWKPLGQTRNLGANIFASLLMVMAWGYFLIQGVRDPLGGINSLWPLFGIANQLLAAVALCLATTIILKMARRRSPGAAPGSGAGLANRKPPAAWRCALPALVTLLPLLWLLAVTMSAGLEKIFNRTDPRIGFLTQARALERQEPALLRSLAVAEDSGDRETIDLVQSALRKNHMQHFNNVLDAAVAGGFLILVAAIFLLSVREWLLLLAGRKSADLKESPAVWLAQYGKGDSRGLQVAGLVALGVALAKELSGQAHLERAQHLSGDCSAAADHPGAASDSNAALRGQITGQVYLAETERRFTGIRRCC